MPILNRMKRKINPASPICFVQDCGFLVLSLVRPLYVPFLWSLLRFFGTSKLCVSSTGGTSYNGVEKGKVRKGVVFYSRCIRKGYLSGQKWYTKGFRPWDGASPYKILISTPGISSCFPFGVAVSLPGTLPISTSLVRLLVCSLIFIFCVTLHSYLCSTCVSLCFPYCVLRSHSLTRFHLVPFTFLFLFLPRCIFFAFPPALTFACYLFSVCYF